MSEEETKVFFCYDCDKEKPCIHICLDSGYSKPIYCPYNMTPVLECNWIKETKQNMLLIRQYKG